MEVEQALTIVEALSDGVNPDTGEVLANESALYPSFLRMRVSELLR